MDERTILDALHWRYATKQFDVIKKISPEDLNTLKESARLTASSFGLQPFRIVHVKSAELRKKLRAAAWDQSQITDASDLFIFAAKTDLSGKDIEEYVHNIATTRGIPVESLDAYKGMMLGFEQGLPQDQKVIWSHKQAYIALGNLLTSAALLKIDACPMEGFDAPEFNKILGLTEQNLAASVICTLGYRSSQDQTAHYKKVRVPTSKFFIEK